MSEEARTQESVNDTSQVSEETSVETAESENTEDTEVSEGQSIPYKRFSEVNSQKKEYKEKLEKLEAKLKDYEWVEGFNKILAEDPDKEQMMIDILTGKKAKKEVAEEDDDELTVIKKELADIKAGRDKDKKVSEAKMYAAYEDDFQETVKGTEKDSLLNTILKAATAQVLDNKYKGWRERHIPNLVGKAYKDVQEQLSTYLNKEKKDYIDKKTSTPDIGKGKTGVTIDKVPFGDEKAMAEFTKKIMTGT